MIGSWAELKEYVKADFRSMPQPLTLRTIVVDPVARFTLIMRAYEFLLNTSKPRILRLPAKVWFRGLSIRLGFSVSPNTFGPGVGIVHYGLLIIAPGTRIGKNCRVHMGTHIGGPGFFASVDDARKYYPQIGDNVYLGPGCKIYGAITIGNNCTIGANAVVTKSFPEDNSVIGGIPAAVISTRTTDRSVIKGAG